MNMNWRGVWFSARVTSFEKHLNTSRFCEIFQISITTYMPLNENKMYKVNTL